MNRFNEIFDFYSESGEIFFDNNISYKLPDTGYEDIISIAAIACTENSKFMTGN